MVAPLGFYGNYIRVLFAVLNKSLREQPKNSACMATYLTFDKLQLDILEANVRSNS